MQTKIQKWGNSLALRIPKDIAQQTCIERETMVELTVRDGQLTVTPIRPTLEHLLAQITPDTLHGELDTGGPVGKEAW